MLVQKTETPRTCFIVMLLPSSMRYGPLVLVQKSILFDTLSVSFNLFLYVLQIKALPVKILPGFPRGLSQYVDRGTLEICLHLIALSLSMVSAICFPVSCVFN